MRNDVTQLVSPCALASPLRTTVQTIRDVVLGKQAWIRKHQVAFQHHILAPTLRYESGETH
ncbi:MAG: hypothetical protein ACRYFX_03475 [Janthinobacterium lividum]